MTDFALAASKFLLAHQYGYNAFHEALEGGYQEKSDAEMVQWALKEASITLEEIEEVEPLLIGRLVLLLGIWPGIPNGNMKRAATRFLLHYRMRCSRMRASHFRSWRRRSCNATDHPDSSFSHSF